MLETTSMLEEKVVLESTAKQDLMKTIAELKANLEDSSAHEQTLKRQHHQQVSELQSKLTQMNAEIEFLQNVHEEDRNSIRTELEAAEANRSADKISFTAELEAHKKEKELLQAEFSHHLLTFENSTKNQIDALKEEVEGKNEERGRLYNTIANLERELCSERKNMLLLQSAWNTRETEVFQIVSLKYMHTILMHI
jgi:hypothetical protein